MEVKFIPYQPAMNIRGVKMAVIMVSMVMTVFCFKSKED